MPCAPGNPFTIDPAAAIFQRFDIVACSFDMIACSNTCLGLSPVSAPLLPQALRVYSIVGTLSIITDTVGNDCVAALVPFPFIGIQFIPISPATSLPPHSPRLPRRSSVRNENGRRQPGVWRRESHRERLLLLTRLREMQTGAYHPPAGLVESMHTHHIGATNRLLHLYQEHRWGVTIWSHAPRGHFTEPEPAGGGIEASLGKTGAGTGKGHGGRDQECRGMKSCGYFDMPPGTRCKGDQRVVRPTSRQTSAVTQLAAMIQAPCHHPETPCNLSLCPARRNVGQVGGETRIDESKRVKMTSSYPTSSGQDGNRGGGRHVGAISDLAVSVEPPAVYLATVTQCLDRTP